LKFPAANLQEAEFGAVNNFSGKVIARSRLNVKKRVLEGLVDSFKESSAT
jgi:hypothetical protein